MLSYPRAQPILSTVNNQTRYQSLYTQLANALQIHEEARQRGQLSLGVPSRKQGGSPGDKPFILFTQLRYQKKVADKFSSGSRDALDCWNCGMPGHRMRQCTKPLNAAAIAARKADF